MMVRSLGTEDFGTLLSCSVLVKLRIVVLNCYVKDWWK